MKVFGIDFEPLGTPLRRHIETISAAICFCSLTIFSIVGLLLNLFILLYTPFWIFALIYFWWIWKDLPTTQMGGRRSNWVRGWKIFKYAVDYYPITLIIPPGLKLDPKRNYLFCGFPHAIFPCGTVISLCTKACDVEKVFPNHTVSGATLDVNLKFPFYRDFLMAIGFSSVSADSLNYILQYPYGGKIAVIIVGGAAEVYVSRPGDYKIVLKNRKGFVKLAIKNGTPLVPVYGFGEVDAFNQYIPPNDSHLKKLQEWLKGKLSFATPIFSGRGIFQKTFGWAPFRKPINVVVGKPIEVVKNDNPSQEEVNNLHKVFMDEITELFEEYKYLFVDDAVNKKLIIV